MIEALRYLRDGVEREAREARSSADRAHGKWVEYPDPDEATAVDIAYRVALLEAQMLTRLEQAIGRAVVYAETYAKLEQIEDAAAIARAVAEQESAR